MNHLLKRENLAFIHPCSDECVCFLCQSLPSSFSLRPGDRSGFSQALVKPPEVGIGVRTISGTPKEKDEVVMGAGSWLGSLQCVGFDWQDPQVP